jgi:transcriptional regulator of aromatic amino acid metabolism
VKWMRCGAPFALPPEEVGALILRDVGALGPQQQAGLTAWIDAHPRTTIVSTTAHPLFAFVTRELFDAELYYRLNVLLLSDDMETGQTRRPS